MRDLRLAVNSFRTVEIENFQKIEIEICKNFSAIFSATTKAKWVEFGLIRKLSSCSFISACQNFELDLGSNVTAAETYRSYMNENAPVRTERVNES